nr:4-phosphoerythronate dehydrogenase [Rhodothermus marinus]
MLLHPGLQRPLRIVADENIPFAREAFRGFGVVRPLPADQITPATVRNCDVLLVRSVTRVDAALLEGSRVQFVGSATSGIDHVDLAYLQKRGIAFAYAPGANADAVVEYVLAALLELAVRRNVSLRGRVVGIVGCGHIGGRLARRLPALGLEVLCCDPPLAEQTGRTDFVSLETILAEADIVTLHVPLTRTGPHATYHLIDAAALARLRPSAWLLNTSRGAVVDGRALLEARRQGVRRRSCWTSGKRTGARSGTGRPRGHRHATHRRTFLRRQGAGHAHAGRSAGPASEPAAAGRRQRAAPASTRRSAGPDPARLSAG